MWVARNKVGKLEIFSKKPKRNTLFDEWIASDYDRCPIMEGLLTLANIKHPEWEDEPIEVSIVNTEYLNNLEKIMDMYEEEHCSVDLNKLDNRLENTLNNTSKEMYEKLVDKLNDMTYEDKEKEWEDLKSYNDYDLPINETVDEILKESL